MPNTESKKVHHLKKSVGVIEDENMVIYTYIKKKSLVQSSHIFKETLINPATAALRIFSAPASLSKT